MLPSRNNEEKLEARFLTRLDVLTERVDTLASTVATTSSGLAKKDGEIAALQRALEARDRTLQALVEHVNRAAQAPAADASVDANELRSLRNAVAALTKERASGVNAAHIEQLVTTVRALTERVNALAAAAAAPPVPAPDPAVTARVDAVEAELASVKTTLERPPRELVEELATLRERVEGLAERESGVAEEELDRRFADRDEAFTKLAGRLDALAETVEAAAASLGEKENELASLQLHFTESSTRIESIVDDIREALHAFPEPSATSADELAARLERLETAARKANETSARAAGELSGRIDAIDQRLASVADEMSRAKTLWPVALRSLEARLDDVVQTGKLEAPAAEVAPEPGSADVPDDLLAGLRDSLHAMESVAAEMARASETLTEIATADDVVDPEAPSAATGGATIVPLRAGEP